MSQVLLLKIGSDGLATEMASASDDITLASFTAGAGPVMSATGIDMNNTAASDLGELSFTDPATDGIVQTAGVVAADNLMAKERSNALTVDADILFPVVTDDADELDMLRLPAIAGVPSASPTASGEGFLVWDSTGDRLFAWTGALWKDLSDADSVVNPYTAGEALAEADALYISAANTVSKAKGDAIATARFIGFAKAAALLGASVGVISSGVATGFTSLTAGGPVYLSPATAGAVTQTLPVGTGNVIVQLGYAKNTTDIQIEIERLGVRA